MRRSHNYAILLILDGSSRSTALWLLCHLWSIARSSFWKFRGWYFVGSFLVRWRHRYHWTVHNLGIAVNVDIIRFSSNGWAFCRCLALNWISDILNWCQSCLNLTRSLIRCSIGWMSIRFAWSHSWRSVIISTLSLNDFEIMMIGEHAISLVYDFIGFQFSLDHGKIAGVSILIFRSCLLLSLLLSWNSLI